jgi:hypothetical protein
MSRATYTAKSLDDIAEHFARMLPGLKQQKAMARPQEAALIQREIATLENVIYVLRNTLLELA